jgi:hypothetical protein
MTTQTNILSTTNRLLRDLSEIRAVVDRCQAELTLTSVNSEVDSFSQKINDTAIVRHVKSAIFNDDVAELTLLQRFLRIGCWASMPVFFLKILLLSMGSISLIMLSVFPAEVLSALIVTPYLINIANPAMRYRAMQFFAQKYKAFRQKLMAKQQQQQRLELEEAETQAVYDSKPNG